MKGLSSTSSYAGQLGSAKWNGFKVREAKHFTDYLRNVVRPRIEDAAASFEQTIKGLATTGMATEFVTRLLDATPEPHGWEIGEALAECLLAGDQTREICWPWNTVRDRRSPRASLPGADLIGFCSEAGLVILLIGEVKTSSAKATPPDVMYGGSGMTWQLEENATKLEIQRTLLAWLCVRCQTPTHRDLYRKAVSRYLKSRGRELLVLGVLVRDTNPSQRDLKSRAGTLAASLPAPTRIELQAWYLPVSIDRWADLLRERQ